MNYLEPFNQTKLYGLGDFLNEFIKLDNLNNLPNKMLFSGPKGTGKSTLAYHLINYILTKNENRKYDLDNFQINKDSTTYKTILNGSNPNLIIIDINSEKKSIDINQIRNLIINLNKSSFNNKPRFVLIDNIEFLNTNSINALLKILEEPNYNIHFILINNNKRILPTLLSRCINFKVTLTNKESLTVANILLEGNLENLINDDLIDYYFTPGTIYNLVKFAESNKIDLSNLNLKNFLKLIINESYYKKDPFIQYMIFHFIEFYFQKISLSFSKKLIEKYSYFLKKISDTKNYNLDLESLFLEFEDEILNG